jgi:uncharacterized membrane protein
LIFVPETELIRLDMPVADAIKAIISLGAVTPEYLSQLPVQRRPGVEATAAPSLNEPVAS